MKTYAALHRSTNVQIHDILSKLQGSCLYNRFFTAAIHTADYDADVLTKFDKVKHLPYHILSYHSLSEALVLCKPAKILKRCSNIQVFIQNELQCAVCQKQRIPYPANDLCFFTLNEEHTEYRTCPADKFVGFFFAVICLKQCSSSAAKCSGRDICAVLQSRIHLLIIHIVIISECSKQCYVLNGIQL